MPKITLHFTDSEFNSLLRDNPEFARVLKTGMSLNRRRENTKFGEMCRHLHEKILERGGPVPVSEFEIDAELMGISRAVMYAARKHCGIRTKIIGYGADRTTYWYLQ